MGFWNMLLKGSETMMETQRKEMIRTRKGTKWEINSSDLEVRAFTWKGKKWWGLYKWKR